MVCIIYMQVMHNLLFSHALSTFVERVGASKNHSISKSVNGSRLPCVTPLLWVLLINSTCFCLLTRFICLEMSYFCYRNINT